MMTPVVVLLGATARLALGLLALLSAGHKLADRSRATEAATGLLGVTAPWGAWAAGAAAAIEAAGGAALILPLPAAWGAAPLIALWLGYTALLSAARVGGRSIADCGCSFGGAKAGPPGIFALARNLMLLALGGWVLMSGAPASLVLGAEALLPALAFLGLYLAADALDASGAKARSLP